MLVGVCDFPSDYAFPPPAYGGIERWLWAVANGARNAGADVHLLGPGWLPELEEVWTRKPIRLEDTRTGSLEEGDLISSRYDLLIVGHEYPSHPEWRRMAARLDCEVATFQHAPSFEHQHDAFDANRSRLYCYSPEMADRFAAHQPGVELAVHLGLDEYEPPARSGEDLVWLGRIDGDKAPHIAARAAQMLGRRLRIVGPVFDETYVEEHRHLLAADHVDWVGELGGRAKIDALQDAAAFVYTYARDYIEAGAAVFGEALRAGTPIAALAWRPGTCAEAALCDQTGAVALADAALDDTAAAERLAEAIERTSTLHHTQVQAVGQNRFDVVRHFKAMATALC